MEYLVGSRARAQWRLDRCPSSPSVLPQLPLMLRVGEEHPSDEGAAMGKMFNGAA